jgi:hypothetical protein
LDQVVHWSATTTEAVRRAIRHSQESLSTLVGLARSLYRRVDRFALNSSTEADIWLGHWAKSGHPQPYIVCAMLGCSFTAHVKVEWPRLSRRDMPQITVRVGNVLPSAGIILEANRPFCRSHPVPKCISLARSLRRLLLGGCFMKRTLMSAAVALAFVLTLPRPAPAQDLASQLVGVWNLNSQVRKELATGATSNSFGESRPASSS